ncbi:hypothetical protein Rsub_00757 [Raphidocelis subcapitata]|uniref:Uncharacterized protein n=1 Tax=Raphidocelis subcapitata TaxID=307507 RepID=A0A2V0NT84_9CHLO|nr:hypothetical protein Rsub_00757 [Raphidocelis subcapitata]|eukprot:GBF88045.1 hypothetical protein Rsub_00757 [Raphidocelis subcapitata]
MAAAKTEVLVLPILRRAWLQHVCRADASAAPPPAPWTSGSTLGDKARLLAAAAQRWGAAKVDQQWHTIQTAPEGSMNGRLYRLAQWVLRRVDPDESFLKDLPSAPGALVEFRHPTSVPERLLRRRLRLLSRARAPLHQKRTWYWAAAILPQVPLAVLPLPNVPIYYSLWRVWSHYCAGKGARALQASLEVASDAQRRELAARLAALQASGQVALRPGEWPARLVAELAPASAESSGSAAGDAAVGSGSGGSATGDAAGSGSGGGGGGSGQQEQRGHQQQAPRAPLFLADGWLEEVVDPAARQSSALPESAIAKIIERWRQDHLMEHYRAAERRCLDKDAATSSGGAGGKAV